MLQARGNFQTTTHKSFCVANVAKSVAILRHCDRMSRLAKEQEPLKVQCKEAMHCVQANTMDPSTLVISWRRHYMPLENAGYKAMCPVILCRESSICSRGYWRRLSGS